MIDSLGSLKVEVFKPIPPRDIDDLTEDLGKNLVRNSISRQLVLG